MSRARLFVCLPLLGLSGAATAAAPHTPDEWLELMNRAVAERTYDGVFSYYDGEDLSTLRVVHTVVDGVQHERLVHLDGAKREIVRSDGDVRCIVEPDDEMLKLQGRIPTGPFPRAFPGTGAQVSDNYSMQMSGGGRVANRAAVRISIDPRDQDRYGYRLWLDDQKGLLLRSELIDATGKRLEILQFTSVRIDEPIAPSDLEPAMRDAGSVSGLTFATVAKPVVAEVTEAAEVDTHWQVGWVPEGFVVAAADRTHTPASLQPVDTRMYSDGLAAFTVFVEEMPATGGSALVSSQGATVAVTQAAQGPHAQRFLVTVVGEIPVATAQRVAHSVRWNDDEQ